MKTLLILVFFLNAMICSAGVNTRLDVSAQSAQPEAFSNVTSLSPSTDGKIFVGGSLISSNCFVCPWLIRLNPDGTRDASFQPPSITVMGIRQIEKLVPEPNGGIILCGDSSCVRMNVDGSVDTSFNPRNLPVRGGSKINPVGVTSTGAAITQVEWANSSGGYGGCVVQLDSTGAFDRVIALEHGIFKFIGNGPDGKFLILANSRIAQFFADAIFERLVSTHIDSYSASTLFLPDSSIVLVDSWQILKYRADLTIDPQFKVTIDSTKAGPVSGAVLGRDSKILVYGAFKTLNGEPAPNIARLNPDGTLDPSFSPSTEVITLFENAFSADPWIQFPAVATSRGILLAIKTSPDRQNELIHITNNGASISTVSP